MQDHSTNPQTDVVMTYNDQTGLPVRTVFIDSLQEELVKGMPCAVLRISFGSVPNLSRRQVGTCVATGLTKCLRQTDVSTKYGEGDFVAFASQVEATAMVGLAARIRDAVRESCRIQYGSAAANAVVVWIGVALYPADGTEAAALVLRADAATEQARGNAVELAQEGRVAVSFYADVPSVD